MKTKSKQIAKNTIVLYIRMILTMIITLFTSRIVLKELGFGDYGLYNVVGGVVALFAFLRSSMSSSTQRFLSYEMGKGNIENLRKTFSICFSTHLLIAGLLLLIAETIGFWFLNSYINIPVGREIAANYIYQFSVISLSISVISIPYTAAIISYEKMGYFAFLGVTDAILKLVIAYMIIISPFDKLVFYGFLMMLINLLNLLFNWIYCHIKYNATHYKFYWDKDAFKKVFSFSGWTIWGQLAVVGSNQGSNILVNMFFSVVANAAMGVGSQVNQALTGLVSNFQTAFKPQITKSYAEKDFDYLNNLSIYASKISFFLLFLVSLPVVVNINFVLSFWLGNVPQYANSVCVIFIFASLCNAISAPLWMNVFSTGNIKAYQLGLSVAYIVELLLVYVIFKFGLPLECGVAMKAALNFIVIFIRLYYCKHSVPEFDVKKYMSKVVAPLLTISIIFYSIAIFVIRFNDFYFSILSSIIIEILALVVIYYKGLDKGERHSAEHLITKKIFKK